MKCDNTKCKYYKPAEKSEWFNFIIAGGCKFPYCKKDRKKKMRWR